MTRWWWWSAPYSIVFIASIYGSPLFGTSAAALGHSGIILPFLALAVASVSSALWFLSTVRGLINRTIRMDVKCGLMLSLSAVAGAWVGLYLAKA